MRPKEFEHTKRTNDIQRALRTYRRVKKQGVCFRCRQPTTGGVYCADHQKEFNEKTVNLYYDRKNKGLCVSCGIPTEKTRCKACIDYINRYRDQRIAKGICVTCGRAEVAKYRNCAPCRSRIAKRHKAWRESKTANT